MAEQNKCNDAIGLPMHQVRHIPQPHKAHTHSNAAVSACLFPTLPGHTLPRWTQSFSLTHQDEGRTYNIRFAVRLAEAVTMGDRSLSYFIRLSSQLSFHRRNKFSKLIYLYLEGINFLILIFNDLLLFLHRFYQGSNKFPIG